MEEITYLMKLEVPQKLNIDFQIAGKNITFLILLIIIHYLGLVKHLQDSLLMRLIDFKEQCLGREVRNSEPHRNNSS